MGYLSVKQGIQLSIYSQGIIDVIQSNGQVFLCYKSMRLMTNGSTKAAHGLDLPGAGDVRTDGLKVQALNSPTSPSATSGAGTIGICGIAYRFCQRVTNDTSAGKYWTFGTLEMCRSSRILVTRLFLSRNPGSIFGSGAYFGADSSFLRVIAKRLQN